MSWLSRMLNRFLGREVAKSAPTPDEVIRKVDRVFGPDLRELRRYEIIVRRR